MVAQGKQISGATLVGAVNGAESAFVWNLPIYPAPQADKVLQVPSVGHVVPEDGLAAINTLSLV